MSHVSVRPQNSNEQDIIDSLENLAISGPNEGIYKATSTTFGNRTFSSSGGGTWGSITGTLSAQTDLQTALNAKLPLAGGIMTGNILMTSNKIIGGSTTTSDLFLQTTSGVGASGADMHFLVGNNGATEAMTILNSGNVGIGTTSPTHPLHVLGSGGVQVARFESSGNAGVEIVAAGTANYPFLQFDQGATGKMEIGVTGTGDAAGGGVTYFNPTINTGATGATMVLKSGNVGIGTTSPNIGGTANTTVLTVAKTGTVAPIIETYLDYTQGGLVVLGQIKAFGKNSSGTVGEFNRIEFMSDASASSASNMLFYTRNGSGTLAEKMRINYAGNVGIGTTSPTAVLHLKAGVAGASGAPFKMTAGTVNTTPEAGTIEFDGTDFFVTI